MVPNQLDFVDLLSRDDNVLAVPPDDRVCLDHPVLLSGVEAAVGAELDRRRVVGRASLEDSLAEGRACGRFRRDRSTASAAAVVVRLVHVARARAALGAAAAGDVDRTTADDSL